MSSMTRRTGVRTLVYLLASALALVVAFAPAESTAEIPDEVLERYMPLIETGLASEDVAVQSWAIRAAGVIGSRDMRSVLDGALENANAPVRIAGALAMLDAEYHESQALDTLSAALAGEDASTRTLVLARILPQLSESQRREVLDDALRSAESGETRAQLIEHIAFHGHGSVYALLERVVSIDDAEARSVYLEPIRQSERPQSLSIAEELLDSRDPTKKLEGAEIAFALNSVAARELLEPLLDASDPELAQRVGFHLASYGNATALDRVKELALNPEMPEELRIEAISILRDNAAQLVSFAQTMELLEEEGRSEEFRRHVYGLMGATQSPEAIEHLAELLGSVYAEDRLKGLAGIGYTGQHEYEDDLYQILSSAGETPLRIRAAAALGNLGGDSAALKLVDALRIERVPEVKVAIVEALGDTGSREAALPITYEFVQRDDQVTLAGLDALLELGFSDVAPQIQTVATTYRDPTVRWKATIALVKLDPELGRIRLLQALDRPPAGFLDELEGLPDSLIEEVEERLIVHADPEIRDAALARVQQRPDGGVAVLRPLVQEGTTPDVRRLAISTVTAAKDAQDAELYRELISSPDRSIRLQAMAALAELGDPANESFFRGYINHTDVALRMIATYGLLRMHDAS